jgi:hypothetical protein
MTRHPLPQRRTSVTDTVDYHGHAIAITVGLYPDGTPGEVWASTGKGGDMQRTLDDACVLVSLLLQHGVSLADMGKSLGKVPEHRIVDGAMALCDAPASAVGLVVETAMGVGR